MKFIDILTISLKNLFRQKVRTLLTVFSIVIGASLISLVYAVIPGFHKFLDLQLNTLTSDKYIEVFPTEERRGPPAQFGGEQGIEEYDGEGGSNGFSLVGKSFNDSDVESIEKIEGVVRVTETPFVTAEYVKLKNQDNKFKPGFVIYYPKTILGSLDLVAGRFLSDEDVNKVVISNQYMEAFGVTDPDELIGKTVIINVRQISQQPSVDPSNPLAVPQNKPDPVEENYELEIVGVLEKMILSNLMLIPFDNALDMARFYADNERILTDEDDNRIVAMVEIEDASKASEIDEKISELGFYGQTFEDRKSIFNEIFSVLTIVFSSFGVLAMAVSSLGILNTLIMAVYERTREIGVMKAIGAKKNSIALLFTLEAAWIGVFGGLIGTGIGFGLAEILNIWGHKTVLSSFETLDLSNVTPLLLLALGISVVVSTIAGIYPAIRASNLDPVEALRYE